MAANNANIAWPRTAAISPAPATATAAPTRPTSGGARCSRTGSGTAMVIATGSGARLGPRRTTRRHGSWSASAMLPAPGGAAASSPVGGRRKHKRLAPIWSDWPNATRVDAHGTPSRRAGTRPVSCVNVIEPSVPTSTTPWWSSSAGSSSRSRAVGDRPMQCRPAGSGRHPSQEGPVITATSTGDPAHSLVGSGPPTMATSEPTCSPHAVSNSLAATSSPVDPQPGIGFAVERPSEVGDRVGGRERAHRGAPPVDDHVTGGNRVGWWCRVRSHTRQWAATTAVRHHISDRDRAVENRS